MNTTSAIIESVWTVLGRASLYAAIVFPVAWIACQFLNRVPRRIHCWIWRLAYLKVIVASVWIVPIAVPILPASNINTVSSVETAQMSTQESSLVGTQTGVSQEELAPYVFRWTHLLVVVWLFGFAIFVSRLVREWIYSLRVRRSGVPSTSTRLTKLYRMAATAMGVVRTPRLLETDKIDAPALVGVFHPAVVVPAGLADRIHADELSLVLRHEMGHLKRSDLLWNLLARVVHLVLFFHPMTWLASRRWRLAQEAACDELVLQSPDAHSTIYANALIRVAELMRHDPGERFSMVGVVSSFRSLRERIVAMQSVADWSRSGFAAAACGVLLIALVGIIPWKLVAQKPEIGFVNGDFESGDTTGWTVSSGTNAEFKYEGVTPFDIRGINTGEESKAFSLSVGQISHESDVYRHADITQDMFFELGQQYEISFDWAVQNFFYIDNFDGGTFELIVDGKPLASFDTQNIFTESIERGTLSASFTPSRSGRHSVGARVKRRFPIPFPKFDDPVLLQYVDNFRIQPTVSE